ncbi:MAG TPA: STT3 domain-containing protein [Acidobacteriota bacterium]|nr:STT3 domain-containing protein [Acidobacteriota bacterium]
MNVKETLSREHVVDSLKSLGKLRIRISHGSLMAYSALLLILFLAFTIRILPIKWEIQAGGNTLHLTEFDPYFQFHLTQFMVTHQNGFISWVTWNDTQRWYPYGITASAAYPGLPATAAFLYDIISMLGINISLMNFCAILPPIMGMLACLALYFLGKDLGGKSIGLIAALFLALDPSFIQRSGLGWLDDEITGILPLIVFVIVFLRAIEENRPALSSLKYAIASGLILGYFTAGWGASLYPIGATILFVATLILFKRYSQRLLWSYSLTFGLGLFIAINTPRLSPSYLTTFVILAAAGVFAVLCFFEISRILSTARSKWIFTIAFLVLLIGGFTAIWQLGYMGSISTKFISIIDPYTRSGSPLYESVAEQRISSWSSIYVEFGVGIIFFIAGFFFALRNLNNKNLFLVILGLTSLYFASSIVRVLVILAPFFGLLAALGIIGILKPFYTLLKEPSKIFAKKKYSSAHVGREFSGTAVFLIFLILMTNFAFAPQTGGTPRVYNQAYAPVTIAAGSLSLVPSQPVTIWMDALQWLSNLPSSATTVVCSWWDYGYWLTMLGNVTSLCDNGTNNSTQIGLVGRVYMSNETQAVRILEEKFNGPNGPPKYVLLFLTFWSTGQDGGYGGDEGKWVWMARIANGSTTVKNLYYPEWPKWEYNEWGPNLQNNTFGDYTSSGFEWNTLGQSTVFYKLSETVKNDTTGAGAGPTLTYFKNPEYFVNVVGSTTSSSGTTVYLYAVVCLFEVDYAAYDLSQ